MVCRERQDSNILLIYKWAAPEVCSLAFRKKLRGGSWNNDAQNLRSAIRNRNDARNRNNNIGFRVAVAPANTLSSAHRAGAVQVLPAAPNPSGPARSRRHLAERPGGPNPCPQH